MLLYAHQEWMKQILIAIDAYYYDSASTVDALYQFQKAVNNGVVVVPLNSSQWKGTGLFGVPNFDLNCPSYPTCIFQSIAYLKSNTQLVLLYLKDIWFGN